MRKEYFKNTNKLKQLDRIEYLIKYNSINETENPWRTLIMATLFYISAILVSPLLLVFVIIFTICAIKELINNFNAKKELFNEYFKIETKKKID